jgi:hypothetical protein
MSPRAPPHFGTLTPSQWIRETTSALTPTHLWRRYILSRPPNQRSGHFGRAARIMAMLIQVIARRPLYWSRRCRKPTVPEEVRTPDSAMSQVMVTRPNVLHHIRLSRFIRYSRTILTTQSASGDEQGKQSFEWRCSI